LKVIFPEALSTCGSSSVLSAERLRRSKSRSDFDATRTRSLKRCRSQRGRISHAFRPTFHDYPENSPFRDSPSLSHAPAVLREVERHRVTTPPAPVLLSACRARC